MKNKHTPSHKNNASVKGQKAGTDPQKKSEKQHIVPPPKPEVSSAPAATQETGGMGDLIPLSFKNGQAVPLSNIPAVRLSIFQHWLQTSTAAGKRVVSFGLLPILPELPQKACPIVQQTSGEDTHPQHRLMAILADDQDSSLLAVSTCVGKSYPSFTLKIPQLHLFERELYEEHGITPEGHPWLKPVRFCKTKGQHIGATEFFRVGGEEVHEVAVGPIHAGVIECGHFRFQCFGEKVMHLEISLGYHLRGVNALLLNSPQERILPMIEAVAGDTTTGHTWAHCTVMEALHGLVPTFKDQLIRGLALELERLANHTGDMGALAGDVGFLPTQSFCGRLRGDWLNMTALLCGSRFGRGLLKVGGVHFDLDKGLLDLLEKRVQDTARDTAGAITLMWDSPTVMGRMIGIGKVRTKDAEELGFCGPAAKSTGIWRDSRFTHPLENTIDPEELETIPWGDVYSRAMIRDIEIKASVKTCLRIIESLRTILWATHEQEHHEQPKATEQVGQPAPLRMAVGLVEGWRGEVCHLGITDSNGKIAGYKIIDPSFHNWIGLALALRGQEISDFPVCNKSFNLSYCGHDL